MIDAMLPRLDPESVSKFTGFAALPQMVRGYGPVKQAAIAQYDAKMIEIQRALA
jgi:hypothetical protein